MNAPNVNVTLNTTSFGVFEFIGNFQSITDFANYSQVMTAIEGTSSVNGESDGILVTSQAGHDFLVILRNTQNNNSYLYHAVDSGEGGEPWFQPGNNNGDTLTLVAVFENTNLAEGGII